MCFGATDNEWTEEEREEFRKENVRDRQRVAKRRWRGCGVVGGEHDMGPNGVCQQCGKKRPDGVL